MAKMRAEKQGDASLAAPEKIDIFFKHLDANGDGRIEQAEMQAARDQRQAKRAERGEARQGEKAGKRGGERREGRRGAKRGQIDANGDNIVTRAEFGARALERFERADANGDGVVTAQERSASREARKGARN